MMTIRAGAALACAALLLSALAVVAQGPTADPPSDDRRARFEGTWRLATPRARANQLIDRAASETADAMNFFVRGMVRSRLREGTSLYSEIELRFEPGERLFVRFGDEDRYTTRIGRTERRQNHAGEARRVTQRFRPGGQLEQVFETESGTRWYIWTPNGEGRMRLEVVTDSPRLPQPMRFSLQYRREGAPAAQGPGPGTTTEVSSPAVRDQERALSPAG